jgi:hypothetical protein
MPAAAANQKPSSTANNQHEEEQQRVQVTPRRLVIAQPTTLRTTLLEPGSPSMQSPGSPSRAEVNDMSRRLNSVMNRRPSPQVASIAHPVLDRDHLLRTRIFDASMEKLKRSEGPASTEQLKRIDKLDAYMQKRETPPSSPRVDIASPLDRFMPTSASGPRGPRRPTAVIRDGSVATNGDGTHPLMYTWCVYIFQECIFLILDPCCVRPSNTRV